MRSTRHKRTHTQTNMAEQPVPIPITTNDGTSGAFSSIIDKFWVIQGQFRWLGTGMDPERSYLSWRHTSCTSPHRSSHTTKVYERFSESCLFPLVKPYFSTVLHSCIIFLYHNYNKLRHPIPKKHTKVHSKE
jgi:hypothetical protein